MQTELIALDAVSPQADAIARAAAVLRRGGLVAFPTETVYGLGANALDANAITAIFSAKGRPANNPLIVHLAKAGDVRQVAADWPAIAAQLAARFWPGPLTLVLPKNDAVPAVVTAGGPTVAVRVPAHPVAQALIRAAAVPIAAPSANRSTELSPTRAEHVLRSLDGAIDMILDAGPTPGGLESTVLDVTVTPPRLLRPGLVTVPELEAVIGPIGQHGSCGSDGDAAALRSPGMAVRHYAPSTPLECVEGDSRSRIKALRPNGGQVAWVKFAAEESFNRPDLLCCFLPPDAESAAANLYALLHQLDDRGLARIVVELPPDTPEWQAIRDRLRRAAS